MAAGVGDSTPQNTEKHSPLSALHEERSVVKSCLLWNVSQQEITIGARAKRELYFKDRFIDCTILSPSLDEYQIHQIPYHDPI
jgi:hypothetical protein